MAKVFEDYFMELQIEMLQQAVDSIYDDADMIYVYGACEDGHFGSAFFYEKDGKVFDSHSLGILAEKNNDVEGLVSRGRKMTCLVEELFAVCKEHKRPMPTEIKLYYDCIQGKLDTEYQYEPVFSFDEDKIPYDVFTEWEEEVKKAKGQL